MTAEALNAGFCKDLSMTFQRAGEGFKICENLLSIIPAESKNSLYQGI